MSNQRQNSRKNTKRNTISKLNNQIRSLQNEIKIGSYLIRGSYDPPTYNRSATYQRRIRIRPTSDTTTTTLTPLQLFSQIFVIPSQNSDHVAIRIDSLHLWGSDAANPATNASLALVLTEGSDFSGSNTVSGTTTYTDVGVPGSRRAQIHVRPSRDLREKWFDSTSTDPLAVIQAAQVIDANISFRITVITTQL